MKGSPGSGPRRLARRRALTGRLVTAGAAVMAMAALWFDQPFVSLLAVAGAFLASRWYGRAAARARAGADGEEQVASALRRVRADVVAFDVRVPGRSGDVDVVLLGPMAAVVEVKRASGRVVLRSDGTVRAGGRLLPGSPGRQVLAAAASVRVALGLAEPVDAVLCVTGMRQRPRRVRLGSSDVFVCSARHLRRVVGRLEVKHSPGELVSAAGSLAGW